MKILIVEDKRIVAEDIVDRLVSFGHRQILGPFATGEAAYDHCLKELPDIAILDIRLEGKMDGIELATKLNSIQKVPIIYLTNQEDEKTFQLSENTFPVAYINKPFTNNELKTAIRNAKRLSGKIEETPVIEELKIIDDKIFVRNGRGRVPVDLDHILWINSNGGETSSIVTTHNRNKDPKLRPVVGHNLSRLEDRLGFYPFLRRASRFHIVNLKKVERIIDMDMPNGKGIKKVILIAGEEIVIGEKYRKNVLKEFHIL